MGKIKKKAAPKPDASITTPDIKQLMQRMDDDAGPETSPYTSPMCRLVFQSGLSFNITRDVLNKSRIQNVCNDSISLSCLSDVPDDAGHVLVHYLHTGTYQTLKAISEVSEATNGLSPFEVGLYVYATARICEVPALAELAKERILKYALALSPLQILRTVRDGAHLLLTGEDPWLLDFISFHTRQVFRDPRAVDVEAFLTCFGRLDDFPKWLARNMIHLCSEKGGPSAQHPSPVDEHPPDIFAKPQDSAGKMHFDELESTSVQVASLEPLAAQELVEWPTASDAMGERSAVSEPMDEPPAAPESVDELHVPPKSIDEHLHELELASPPPVEEPAPVEVLEPVVESIADHSIQVNGDTNTAEHEKPLDNDTRAVGSEDPAPAASLLPSDQPLQQPSMQSSPDLGKPPEPEVVSKKKKKGKKGKKGEKGEKAAPPPCADRETHVTGNGWEECQDCLAFVSRLSADFKAKGVVV